ncbi:MAG: prephenate dehydrogenase dimerization domain-containing protein, partial [Chloroflexota bacterium]
LRPGDEAAWSLAPIAASAIDGRSAMRLDPADRAPRLRANCLVKGRLSELIDQLGGDDPEGCTVVAVGPNDAAKLLPRADLTVLAIGLEGKSSFADAIGHYARWFRPNSLVVDLGSTKAEPLDILDRTVDPRVGLLGAHPLFGPAVSDVTGLIVAVVDPPGGRAVSPWREWFLARLAEQRLIVTPTTAVEHDDAMSFVQALTHFTLLSFAYTFVRLDQDPAELLKFRTPVFEPLLYLASRVAHLARTNPDTYRSIQYHTRRPDVRAAFLAAATEIVSAVDAGHPGTDAEPPGASPDRLAQIFARYGAPWSPDRSDRRDRQRREHFLEMGARLVDGLNRLREDVVSSAGQVRAVEERRRGQPPRVVVGIVDLDLLDPGKQDVASRIRLRPINLVLGSAQGGEGADPDGTHDLIIPLARARVLGDDELFDWLLRQGDLVERRSCDLLVPRWFDGQILTRLLKGFPHDRAERSSRVWEVEVEAIEPSPTSTTVPSGQVAARVTLSIVSHPAEIVETRRAVQRSVASESDTRLRELDSAISRARLATPRGAVPRELARNKDDLKRQRKRLTDWRTMVVDREVRRLTRLRVHEIYQGTLSWLNQHGCSGLC